MGTDSYTRLDCGGWLPIASAPEKTLLWLLVDGERFIGYRAEPRAWSNDPVGDWVLKVVVRDGLEIASTHHVCKAPHLPSAWLPLPLDPSLSNKEEGGAS